MSMPSIRLAVSRNAIFFKKLNECPWVRSVTHWQTSYYGSSWARMWSFQAQPLDSSGRGAQTAKNLKTWSILSRVQNRLEVAGPVQSAS